MIFNHNDKGQPLPLSGIRIVDLTWIVAGPQTTRIFADLGAEVIKVEYKESPDYIRGAPPFADGISGINRSGFFNNLNRNKSSLSLNVMHPDGMDVLKNLISVSDILIENFSSKVLERWGLNYEEQVKIKPDIIYLSLSGFGHSGSKQDYTTWGPTAQALSGLTYMSGFPDEYPSGWGYSFLDHTAGYYGAIALLLALHHRNNMGEGQSIDISQVETGMALTGTYLLDYLMNGRKYKRPGNPPGNRARFDIVAPHNIYRCSGEDRWISVVVSNDDEWGKFCKVINRIDLQKNNLFITNELRITNQDVLDKELEESLKHWDAVELMHLLQKEGVSAGVIQNARDRVASDSQLKERNYFQKIEHPEIGTYEFDGFPAKFSGIGHRMDRSSPLLGQDSKSIISDLLGYKQEDLDRMESEEVF